MPDFFLPLTVAPGAHLFIDPIGGPAQSQFTQGNQISLAEKVFDSPLRLAADIDLAFIQALTEIVMRQVDQHNIVGGVKKGVGDGFAHLNAGNAADDIVQAFEVLDVYGGKHVDTGIEKLFDILPAFGVARAWRIAVRQFINQDQRRPARQRGIEIEFVDVASTMREAALGEGAEPFQHRRGLFPTVGFRHADQNIQSLGAQPLRFRQHCPGFTDARTGAKEHF